MPTTWACVAVVLCFEGEVAAAEGAVLALGLVPDRDVRLDLLLLHQPREHRRRTVGHVSDEVVRLYLQALLNSLDHFLGGFYFLVSDSACCFHIKNDSGLHINEVVGRVTEEGRAPRSRSPNCARIGERDAVALGLLAFA